VGGIKYSSDEERIGTHGDAIPLIVARMARYQVRVTFDPDTGAKIPAGGNTPRTNNERQRDGEASGSNANSTFSVSKDEWVMARKAVVNNSSLPVGVLACNLNAYDAILEKNHSRLAKERADVDRRW
jgi:hypothetical protein